MCFAGNLNPGLFGSVGEDGSVCLWDIRISGLRPVTAWRAHGKGGTALPATGLSFSPLEDSQLVTCGGDGKVKVWDVRSTGERPSTPEAALKVLPSHRNPVTQVSRSPSLLLLSHPDSAAVWTEILTDVLLLRYLGAP